MKYIAWAFIGAISLIPIMLLIFWAVTMLAGVFGWIFFADRRDMKKGGKQ